MFNFTLDLYTTTCKSMCDITTTTTMNVDVEMSRLLLSNMCFTFTETNKSTTARNYRQTLRAIYSDTYFSEDHQIPKKVSQEIQ